MRCAVTAPNDFAANMFISALSRSVLFAEVAANTYLKTCQCLDALSPGNPCAPVDPALTDSTVLASLF